MLAWRRLADAAATERGIAWLRRAVVALLVLGALGFVVLGANRPADPRLAPPGATGAGAPGGRRVPLPGFTEVGFRVQPAVGGNRPASYCALLADTDAQHRRGLMGRYDLGGYDAMVFRFATDVRAQFYNRAVPVALTVAWFARDGRFEGSADMAPCPDVDSCRRFGPPGGRPYRYGLEVPAGGLGRLGVGPGSALVVGGGCPAA